MEWAILIQNKYIIFQIYKKNIIIPLNLLFFYSNFHQY